MKFIRTHDLKSIRLKEFNYSAPGECFITICTYNRECIFGDVINEIMQLSTIGNIVKEEWLRTATIRSDVELDTFVVMPNHIHGIIVLNETNDIHGKGTSQRAHTVERFGKPTSNSIPTIIRLFKSITTKQINKIRHSPGYPSGREIITSILSATIMILIIFVIILTP
jgi:REP element-mobilizing transposase RayT